MNRAAGESTTESTANLAFDGPANGPSGFDRQQVQPGPHSARRGARDPSFTETPAALDYIGRALDTMLQPESTGDLDRYTRRPSNDLTWRAEFFVRFLGVRLSHPALTLFTDTEYPVGFLLAAEHARKTTCSHVELSDDCPRGFTRRPQRAFNEAHLALRLWRRRSRGGGRERLDRHHIPLRDRFFVDDFPFAIHHCTFAGWPFFNVHFWPLAKVVT